MTLISKDFNVTGKHATMFVELTEKKYFDYFWQIYVTAPLIGFIYKRKAEPDSSDFKKTIFLSQLTPRQEFIYFIYKLIMLADSKHEESPEERIKKAFLNIDTELAKPDEDLFLRYLLGGVEILHEKLIEKSSDDIENLCKLIEELTIADNSIADELGINM